MPPLKNLYSFYIDNQHKLNSYSSEEECDATMPNRITSSAWLKIKKARYYTGL